MEAAGDGGRAGTINCGGCSSSTSSVASKVDSELLEVDSAESE